LPRRFLLEQARELQAAIEEQRPYLRTARKPIAPAPVWLHFLGDVFDAEGGHSSLQQTVSMFLDEDAIADATVKVTGGGDEHQVAVQGCLSRGEFFRQRQQYRQPRSIFHC